MRSELSRRQQELSAVEEQVVELKAMIDQKKLDLQRDTKELEKKEKIVSLLPDGQSNIERIEALLQSSREKMAVLEQEWQDVKQPLEDEYELLVNQQQNSLAQKLKKQIEESVAKLKKTVEEIRLKEDLIASCQNQLEAIPSSSLTRSFYTQRILSIVANVKKQNDEMHRVLEDVKVVQREINNLQGKVERIYTVADEVIFQVAKSDEAARRIYKLLVSLHSDCTDILRLVKECGTVSRDIRDLEQQIETEARKNVASKLQQITQDLKQMRLENEALEKQIHKDN